jgi:hypothetical protein
MEAAGDKDIGRGDLISDNVDSVLNRGQNVDMVIREIGQNATPRIR